MIPHIRHLRHRKFERVRHSSNLLGFLSAQAARLGSTASAVFKDLIGSSAEAIAGAGAVTNTVVPAVTGTAQVGQVLTVSNGTWTPATGLTYAYQWKSGGANVGTNQNTYTPVAGDVGKTITATVTATAGVASASATSAATAAVIA